MNQFNDQVNFWAHMLDESIHQIDESIEEFISPKTNIVCIQCLFRNLLTKNLLNVQTDVINTSNRKGLDFEVYFQVDGNVMRSLLDAKILVSNIKDISPIVDSEQIVDILASEQPIAAFLTDSYGNAIIDDIVSPKSREILKQRNAQSPNVSAFRFTFFNADYDIIWKKVYGLKDSNDILKPGSYVQNWNKKDLASIKIGDQIIPKDELNEKALYLLGGYWNRIRYNGDLDEFEVDKNQVIKPIIPVVKSKIGKYEATALWNATKTFDNVDDSKLIDFISLAIQKSKETGNDLRVKTSTKANESEIDEADDIVNEITADNIYELVDASMQKMLTFGDEFYDVEILDDLTLKAVIAGDADIEVHSVDKNNFDDYGKIRVNSDFSDTLLQKLCDNVNEMLNANGVEVHYIVEANDAKNAAQTVNDSAQQEYDSFGKTHVRYACDVTFRMKK